MALALLFMAHVLAADVLELPFERLEGGHLAVQVGVEDSPPGQFVVDSAASVTTFSTGIWAAAGHDPAEGRQIGASGADGMASVRLAKGPTLRLGGAELELPYAVVTDLSHLEVAGLLGNDVLRRYAVEVDFEGDVLRLAPPDTEVPDGAIHVKTKKARAKLVQVEVRIQDRSVAAIIDLGAEFSVLNGHAAALPGVQVGGERSSARGVGASELDLVEAQVEGWSIGGRPLRPAELYTADLHVFRALRLHRKPAMILGLDVLGSGTLWIAPGELSWTGASAP